MFILALNVNQARPNRFENRGIYQGPVYPDRIAPALVNFTGNNQGPIGMVNAIFIQARQCLGVFRDRKLPLQGQFIRAPANKIS